MYYVGVDIGGTNIAAGIVDHNCNIVIKDSIPTSKDSSHENMKNISRMISNLICNNVVEVKSIGVGIPGIWDNKNGTSVYCPNMKFNDVLVRNELTKKFSLPVYLNNDANCAALAESVNGAAKSSQISITVTLGTGIGTGIIINGKIYSGVNGAAVEFGHSVICIGGEKCKCGRQGCWEVYGSATALVKQAKRAVIRHPHCKIAKVVSGDLSKITPKQIFDAAISGDSTMCSVVDKYLDFVSQGLANMITVFQPEVVVLSGGIMNQGEYLLEKIKMRVDNWVFGKGYIDTAYLKLAQLGNDAGIVGAAMLEQEAQNSE